MLISRNQFDSLEEATAVQKRFPFCGVCKRNVSLQPYGDSFYLVCLSHLDGTGRFNVARFQPYLFDVFGITYREVEEDYRDAQNRPVKRIVRRAMAIPPYHHGIRDRIVEDKPKPKPGEAPEKGQKWMH